MPFLFASSEMFPITYVIWAICIGSNIGFLYLYFVRNIVGSVVRKLLASAQGEDNAKTLSELGYSKFSLFHKFLLKDGGALRSCVSVVGGEIPKISNLRGETEPDFDNAKFYISAESKDKAQRSYGNPFKWMYLPIFIVASIIISIIMCIVMPIIIDLIPSNN